MLIKYTQIKPTQNLIIIIIFLDSSSSVKSIPSTIPFTFCVNQTTNFEIIIILIISHLKRNTVEFVNPSKDYFLFVFLAKQTMFNISHCSSTST